MGRCSLVVLAVLSAVLASGCGAKDPSPPSLTPEEERQYEEQLQRRREQEGRSPRPKQSN